MNWEEGLKSREIAGKLTARIKKSTAGYSGTICIMEVCGTHTVALRRSGIHSLLPDNIRLISGPGCPVCVTPTGYIDNALDLASEKDIIVATFGDMVKVPGSNRASLSSFMGEDKIKIVYSPGELITLANHTDKQVVFLGIGFETTIPTIASVFLRASREKMKNLFLYTAFKTVPPALKALLQDKNRYFNGFLLPGHVSAVIGRKAYDFLTEENGVPGVIAGFEPADMLSGIASLVELIIQERNAVVNGYTRAVREDGNRKAREVISELLEPGEERWRSLGIIPDSGLRLKKEFQAFDAEKVFSLPPVIDKEQPGCICGEVILGKAAPAECGLFGTECTPDHPVGPCMVSSEGTCSAYLRYTI